MLDVELNIEDEGVEYWVEPAGSEGKIVASFTSEGSFSVSLNFEPEVLEHFISCLTIALNKVKSETPKKQLREEKS